MLAFLISQATGIAVGVALKTLVPMPWLDDPIRAVWRAAKNGVKSLFS